MREIDKGMGGDISRRNRGLNSITGAHGYTIHMRRGRGTSNSDTRMGSRCGRAAGGNGRWIGGREVMMGVGGRVQAVGGGKGAEKLQARGGMMR